MSFSKNWFRCRASMHYQLFNYASGVASVTLFPVQAYAQAVEQAEYWAAERSRDQGLSEQDALRCYFAERRTGQLGYLVVSLVCLLLTAALVHQAPEGLLCLLALMPLVLFVMAQGYTHYIRRRLSLSRKTGESA